MGYLNLTNQENTVLVSVFYRLGKNSLETWGKKPSNYEKIQQENH
jgi:hypothetical protein